MFNCMVILVSAIVTMAEAELVITPLPSHAFGAEVHGLQLADISFKDRSYLADASMYQLKEALHRHRLLIIRNQISIPWQTQLNLTSQFGSIFNESRHSNRKPHASIPDPRVARFSNNPEEGLTGIGIEGWHVDGNCVPIPHAITLIHCIMAIPNGNTRLVPLKEVVSTLRERNQLEPLESINFHSATDNTISHPLVYPHPSTGEDTMMFGLGSLSGQYSDADTGVMSVAATQGVMDVIENAIETAGDVLTWDWREGDLLILDNLALAHMAVPNTQDSHTQVGTRLLQRTTVEGQRLPTQRPSITQLHHKACMVENMTGYDDVVCMISLFDQLPQTLGGFLSRDEARGACRQLVSPDADLAMPTTPARNNLATSLVDALEEPHWLGADEFPPRVVHWFDGGHMQLNDSDELPWESPWHLPSGQPNDCDGPGSETCMFIGPNGAWFDFACGPKLVEEGTTQTAGPEVTWREGYRREFSVFPLCQLKFQTPTQAEEAGFSVPHTCDSDQRT
eukprot:m.81932 g.81932  ORF g.81932 m.81932 type:complete len:509 (-) comp25472_c0_seq2:381-1907(-)